MDCIWYNGLYTCTPRVGSRQAFQNKLIWFTLLCYLFETKLSDNRTKYEVVIEQYLRSILDISGSRGLCNRTL